MEKYPKIAVLSENLRGRTFEISKAEMSIGSHKDNDICIDDSSVSDHHADIFPCQQCHDNRGTGIEKLGHNPVWRH